MISSTFLLALLIGSGAPEIIQSKSPEEAPPSISKACSEKLKELYRPPFDEVIATISQFQAMPEGYRGDVPHYRPKASVIVSIGPDGIPFDVVFDRSSGNRTVDKSLIKWARGMRFAESKCPVRHTLVPFKLQ